MDYLLVAAMSLDAFFACMAYSVKGIKIPFSSKAVLAGIGTLFLGLSLFFKHWIVLLLPGLFVKILSFTVLIIMGLINIFEDKTKSFFKNNLKFKIHFFQFIIEVYVDQTKADADHSHELSPGEAMTLAIPLSIDSLITGLSIAVSWKSTIMMLPMSFLFGLAAATAGIMLGKVNSKENSFPSSLFSGVLLIAIAIFKIL